jgi:exonuclease SbcD
LAATVSHGPKRFVGQLGAFGQKLSETEGAWGLSTHYASSMATFIHTADLHLGRLFYGERLLDDQEIVLDQLVALVAERRPTAVLIAGDVYDRSVPPAEAVALLDDLLVRICGDLNTPVVLIPGNHDSAHRIGFGGRLMGAGRLHIVGPLGAKTEPIVLTDETGEIAVFPIPFLEPGRVREATQCDDVRDQATAWTQVMARVREGAAGRRTVLVGHAFVQGGTISESERPLSIGGAETIDAKLFEGVHYVALGHLHRAQSMGSKRVQYSGSPLKYSVSEVEHIKSFTVVEMDAVGDIEVERVPVQARRDLRRIRGRLADLLTGPVQGDAQDYVVITLEDVGPVHEAMARLRTVYPNTLHIERAVVTATTPGRFVGKDHRELTLEEHFATFFGQVTGAAMTDEESAALRDVLGELATEEGAA